MKTRRQLKSECENKFLLLIGSIEKRLMVTAVFLFSMLLVAQILLYNMVGNRFLNSVYQMEENLFAKESGPIYSTLYIHGDIPEQEDIWVLKNGIHIGQLIEGTPVYVHAYSGDVIEFDATGASGNQYEIIIENISQGSNNSKFPIKILLRNSLYRLPPFY